MPEGTAGPDPRMQAVAGLVARVEGAARWLAWFATRAAVFGGAAGVALWWLTAGDRADDWWQGTAGSILLLALCVAPALWLVNVRMSLMGLLELPETLSGVASRRMPRTPAGGRPPAPAGGALGALRSIWGILRDYGDVAGSWGAVAQLLAPPFWLLTVVALLAIPLVVVLALVAVLLG
ncbi:MAG TPA: hypothetical protein VMZ73_02970 [Acidimicrobiales bacterium]|nr:hypothetical protein [Acidimicrobiales bacterium]